jgi:hypothetical protein
MPTICPNCLRPVRTDAKFCGFCGTNLNPTAHNDPPAMLPSPQESEVPNNNSTAQTRLQPKGRRTRRTVLIILVILLCLVLLIAFLATNWPVISQNFAPILSII